MRQVRLPRLHPRRDLERLADGEMCRVRPMTESVEHKDVETLEQRP